MSYLSPGRPTAETLGTSASTAASGQLESSPSRHVQILDDDTVEALQTKLSIERRVQYGAEKMLDVIDSRQTIDPEQEQVRERITETLDAANDRIRQLEERLEALQGASSTPSRVRRPANKLHAFSSQTSLSSSSSQMLTGSSYRPHKPMTRQPSMLGSDQAALFPLPPSVSGTPSRGLISSPHRRHRRTASYGTSSGVGPGEEATEFPFDRPLSGMISPQEVMLEDEEVQEGLAAFESGMRGLRELGAAAPRGKGKVKAEVDPYDGQRRRRGKDEVWEVMCGMADVLKREEGVRLLLDPQELVESVFPLMMDVQATRRRVAGYRLLRLALDRRSWGVMIDSGMEYILTRTFLRDPKTCSAEREQALRLLRAVLSIPPAPFRAASPYSLNSPISVESSQGLPVPHNSRSRRSSQHGHSRPYGNPPSRNGGLGRSRRTSVSVHSGKSHPPKSSHRLGALQAVLRQKVPLTEGIIRTLVAAAENPDEPLRISCMLTLIELGVMDIHTLTSANGLRTLLHVFNDGPASLGTISTGLLIYLANQPSTRTYLTPGSDVESALVGLTEEYGKVTSPRSMTRRSERLEESGRYAKMLLNSWPGLIYLCANNLRSIRSLIGQLVIPQVEVREATLDLFFDILRIKSKAWRSAFLEGKRMTMYNREQQTRGFPNGEESGDISESPLLNLVDHYISLILAVLLEAGLLEALTVLVEDTAYSGHRKATLLLAETLRLVNRLLPLEYAAKLQALPTLFRLAMDFKKPQDRVAALTALTSVDGVSRNSSKAEKHAMQVGMSEKRSALDRGQKQLQQAKLRVGLQVEDKIFQQMLVDTGVLVVREHVKWNYDLILELIEGPLANPKRLEETIRATKFFKRIFSFLHPYNNRFSSMPRTQANHRWVKLGSTMLELLLANPEGLKFLTEDKLLRQIADCFVELDHHTGIPLNHQAMLSKERIAGTLAYGYLQFIGTLSKHRDGMKLLDHLKVFTSIYHISEQRSREDIMRIVIECLDYHLDTHARTALQKALTTSNIDTRLFVTHHLGRLMHEEPSLRLWALPLMATQLYDISPEICEAAVLYLEELCHDITWLKRLVELRPTLEHLGDVGHPLFMRFVSTSEGFRYLSETGYIARELEDWLVERNVLYVIETETFVTKTLRPLTADTVEDVWQYDSVAPTHFLGELSKTPEGCQLLRDRGLVSDYAEVVRIHGMEEGDDALLMNVKMALWALGNIGSSPSGMALLEDEEVLDFVAEIAEHHPVLSMRGTGFFVLGLLSQTSVGAETLEEYGWLSTRDGSGRPTGLCLPGSLARFTFIESWSPPLSSRPVVAYPDMSERQVEVMTSIGKLSMPNIAPLMLHNLKRVRLRYPAIFQDVDFFARALRHISTCHTPAPVRKFILEMFDVPLDLDVLERLRQLEYPADPAGTLQAPAPSQPFRERESNAKRRQANVYEGTQTSDPDAQRKRASSNPGPGLDVLPPKMRNRGTTVSGLGPASSGGPPQMPSLTIAPLVATQATSPLSSVFTTESLAGPYVEDAEESSGSWQDATDHERA